MGKAGPIAITAEKALKKMLNSVRVDETDCWLIEYGKSTGIGYKSLRADNRDHYAHRFAYEMLKGPIPAGMCVCHSCDKPNCVNPEHLWLGTDADNIRDKQAKGRHRYGENQHNAKLTADMVQTIRANPHLNSGQLSRMFGVSRATIMKARKGQSWAHVPEK